MDIPEEGLTREQIREMLAQLQQLQVDKTNLELKVQELAAERENLRENTRNAQIRLEEQVLRSVPKFRDDGTVLFREHISEICKFIETRSHYLYTEKIKKTILWESLVGRAIHPTLIGSAGIPRFPHKFPGDGEGDYARRPHKRRQLVLRV